MKLATKITLVPLLLAIFNIVGVGMYLYDIQKDSLINRIREERIAALNKFVEVCRESVKAQNKASLANYIRTLKSQPGFVSALFLPKPYAKATLPIDLKLLEQGGIIERDLEEGKRKRRVLAKEVRLGDKPLGSAIITYDTISILMNLKSILSRQTQILILIGAGVLALAGLLAVSVARDLARPIQTLALATQKIGAGHLNYRIPVRGKDELAQLSKSFNEMAAKLQEVDRLKEDFVSSVTHEFRSPLNGIRGFAELLSYEKQGKLNKEQKHYCDLIMQNTEQLGRFVDNILDVAKFEAGLVEFSKESVPVGKIAREVKDLFAPAAKKQKVKLEMDVPGEIYVLADPDSLRQVFSNLVSNALKFTPQRGKITVWARDEGNSSKMGVSDTGGGIPKESIPKLFDKFSQVKEAQKEAKGKGTGLGLTIVKKIIESQGGRIWAESETGKGASFIFTLPSTARYEIMPNRVLVVDDDPSVLELVEGILSPHGFEISICTNAGDALRLFDEARPGLLIVDICLPGTDGWEVIKKVKGEWKGKSVNILVVSALPRKKYQAKALRLGASDYLEKPFSRENLLEKVKELAMG